MAAFTPTLNPRPTLGTGEGPDEVVLVASGTYTATAAQEFVINGSILSLEITINTTAGSTQSTVPTLEAWDIASQTWVVLLTGVAITAASGVVHLLISGNIGAASANVSAAHCVRQRMRINMTHGNGNNHGYSITAVSV